MAALPPPNLPPADLNSRTLRYVSIHPNQFLRISRHRSGEPYFGRAAANRFDDPNPNPALRFGTCYFGLNFKAAFAETVLHNLVSGPAGFSVPIDDITSRYALRFEEKFPTRPLKLAKFYGEPLLLLGGDAELMGTPYTSITRQWAAAMAGHPDNIDGFVYFSRRMNDTMSVVVFERDSKAPPNIKLRDSDELANHPGFAGAITRFRVTFT